MKGNINLNPPCVVQGWGELHAPPHGNALTCSPYTRAGGDTCPFPTCTLAHLRDTRIGRLWLQSIQPIRDGF